MNTSVSFPIAKLLKEKWFHQHHEFSKGYTKNGDLFHQGYGDLNKTQDYFQAPTIAEVVMWLYEKYGIWISVTKDWDVGKCLGFESIIDTNDGFINTETY